MSGVARHIRFAAIEETPVAGALLREVAQWLVARGEALWDEDELDEASIRDRAMLGELVLGFEGGGAAACLFLQNEDRPFWPEAKSGEALYIHRLAVRRAFAGAGWPRRLIDWSAEQARARNRAHLRLDTELRPKLLALYESLGFARIDRDPIVVGGHPIVRFERRV